ncbi:SDR family NAD(P)-dependent oxidoreductase [Zavarzinia sp. CC-PAN008]|uniref:SDR family NAD(P)-dependent oxidoreductase n=1 Tax=Zavarzinia sp. CC-PAN008 TaxID=3243332 RepID=UPI003F746C4B
MDLGLKGLRAAVTGGTRGIGRAIVETLAAEGCSVALCARKGDEVEATVAALKARGATATGQAVDVADAAALKRWVDASAQELGGLDILVANVSALAAGTSEEAWKAAFQVDLMGTINAVEAARPHLLESKAGSIVAISSISGVQVFGGADAYGTFKAALLFYVKGLSDELTPKGIRVNAVSPGSIFFEGGVWDMIKTHMPDRYNHMLSLNPMGRMGTPEEVARVTAFVSSPAASFVSGSNFVVDGAVTKRVQN